MLDEPTGYLATSQVDSMAAQMLKKVSDSVRKSIDNTAAPEHEVVRELTGAAGSSTAAAGVHHRSRAPTQLTQLAQASSRPRARA